MRRGAIPVGVAALALALVPAASAAPSRVATTNSLQAGPALTSNGTAWADGRGRGYAVRSSFPSTGVRTLLRRRLVTDSDPSDTELLSQSLTLAGSPLRLAFSDDVLGGDQYHSERSVDRFAGPSAGSLFGLLSCRTSLMMGQPGNLSTGALAVYNNLVAYVDCQDRTVVRSIGPDATVRTLAVSAADRLSVAGQFVAESVSGAGGDRIRVKNWVTGATAYTVDAADGFDLAPDGTMAAVRRGGSSACAGGRLELHTLAQPAPRRLSVVPCTSGVVFSGGRMAVVAAAARGQRALVLTGADNSRRDVALLGARGVQAGLPGRDNLRTTGPGHDFDGSRAAYALKRCDGHQDVLTVPVANPGPLRALSARCPVSILTRRSNLSRGNRLAFRLRCSRGCVGRVFLRLGRRNGSSARFQFLARRRSRRIAFKTGGTLPRSLRAGRLLRATLVVRTKERTGRTRVTRRRVTLSG